MKKLMSILIILSMPIISLASCGSKPVPVENVGDYIKGDVVGFYYSMPIIRVDNQLIVCSDRSLSKEVDRININSQFINMYGLGGSSVFIISKEDNNFLVSKYNYDEKEKKFKYAHSFKSKYAEIVFVYFKDQPDGYNNEQSIVFADNYHIVLCDETGKELSKISFDDYSKIGVATIFGDIFCYSTKSITIYDNDNNKMRRRTEYKLPEKGNPAQIKCTDTSNFYIDIRTRSIIDGNNLYQITKSNSLQIFHSKINPESELVSNTLLSFKNGLYMILLNRNIDIKVYDGVLRPLAFSESLHTINDYFLFQKSVDNMSKFIIMKIDIDHNRVDCYETDLMDIKVIKSYVVDESNIDRPGHRCFYIFDNNFRYLIDLTNIIYDNSPIRSERLKL